MERIDRIRALRDRLALHRAAGERIGLVPTMGALHAGHLSLVKEARERAERVVVSIFVNPTQFNDPADLEQYPRTLEADLAACCDAGVDYVFCPSAEEMYPDGADTVVEVGALSEPLCGASRPGHFRGVTTVVAKLLQAVAPQVAVFGEKDFQQLAVIRRMARDLLFDVEIVGAPTLREPDGLALSSRNANLDAEARQQALALVRALDAVEAAVAAGERRSSVLRARVESEIARASRAEIDYVGFCDPETLEPVAERLDAPTLLALAVFMRPSPTGEGMTVRLIDNRVLLLQSQTRGDDPS